MSSILEVYSLFLKSQLTVKKNIKLLTFVVVEYCNVNVSAKFHCQKIKKNRLLFEKTIH